MLDDCRKKNTWNRRRRTGKWQYCRKKEGGIIDGRKELGIYSRRKECGVTAGRKEPAVNKGGRTLHYCSEEFEKSGITVGS
jgi:hypothetical protein